MDSKLLILHEGSGLSESLLGSWPPAIKKRIPDMEVFECPTIARAMELIGECDAAFGDIIPELFARAKRLEWIMAPHAGPRAGFYHEQLVKSDVVVTNFREIYNDHLSIHAMMFVLALAKGLHFHLGNQRRQKWERGYQATHLPDSTAVIVGVGGIGRETARLCSEFGMTVVGVDPLVTDPPPGVKELYSPAGLDKALPKGDFVIVTVPETPQTQGLFTLEKFQLMKKTAFFINIGRGGTVVLDDLVEALRAGAIRGAGLDVYETEPLPSEHPLWGMPNVLMTPHVGAETGQHVDDRRTRLFLENCARFNRGDELLNVVDKENWF